MCPWYGPITSCCGEDKMNGKDFTLEDNELILCQEANVRHGFWSLFTGKLVLTNRSLVFIDYGVLGNYRGYIRFDLSEIVQVIVGKSRNGKPQLEIYHAEGDDDFAFKSGGKRKLASWAQAVKKAQARSGAKTSDGKIARVVSKLFLRRA